ncbi:MAG TPA: MJ1477/TM1410 family putative glycoside hydrolase [Chroococcidiopsis sp.]
MATDLAGSSLITARKTGTLKAKPKAFVDSLSTRDRIDYYRITLSRRSTLYASLSKLTANADIELRNPKGQLLLRSAHGSTKSEALVKSLKAGVYFLKVFLRSGKTRYRLNLAAVATATAPIPAGTPVKGDRWLYQLQNASISDINATNFNVLTIDYSRDGSDAGRYTPADLQALHNNGKNVLAYLSIGEAEDYRYYFNPNWVAYDSATQLKQPVPGKAPDWLGQTNPDWEGNYKVKYWSEDWQSTMLGYVDRIIDAGFDGVYLDIIDGFEYWSDQSQLNASGSDETALSQADAANRMIQWVERIAYYARVIRGDTDFQIVPQNGESILAYDQDGSYLRTISGIGIEDLFYDGLTPQPQATVQYRLQWLNRIQANGKPVLLVDYVDDGTGRTGENGDRINNFLNLATNRGYLPYVGRSDRALNTINP